MKTCKSKAQEAVAIATVLVMAENDLGKFKESQLSVLLHKLAKSRGITECEIDGYIELIRG